MGEGEMCENYTVYKAIINRDGWTMWSLSGRDPAYHDITCSKLQRVLKRTPCLYCLAI